MRSQIQAGLCASSTSAVVHGPRPFQHNSSRNAARHRQTHHLICRAESSPADAAVDRRQVLLAGTTAAALLLAPYLDQQGPAAAEELQETSAATAVTTSISSSSSTADGLQLYENTRQQYRMSVPVAWDRKEKAGEAASKATHRTWSRGMLYVCCMYRKL